MWSRLSRVTVSTEPVLSHSESLKPSLGYRYKTLDFREIIGVDTTPSCSSDVLEVYIGIIREFHNGNEEEIHSIDRVLVLEHLDKRLHAKLLVAFYGDLHHEKLFLRNFDIFSNKDSTTINVERLCEDDDDGTVECPYKADCLFKEIKSGQNRQEIIECVSKCDETDTVQFPLTKCPGTTPWVLLQHARA